MKLKFKCLEKISINNLLIEKIILLFISCLAILFLSTLILVFVKIFTIYFSLDIVLSVIGISFCFYILALLYF